MSDIPDAGAFPASGRLGAYVSGLILALVLTALPFGMAMSGAVSGGAAGSIIVACAAIQIVVHLVFFLHMTGSSGQRWSMSALVFAAVVVAIVVVGSSWIMYHLDHNMMSMP